MHTSNEIFRFWSNVSTNVRKYNNFQQFRFFLEKSSVSELRRLEDAFEPCGGPKAFEFSVDRGHMGMPLMHQALRHVMPRGVTGLQLLGRSSAGIIDLS